MDCANRTEEQPVAVCYCGNRKVFPLILHSVLSIAEFSSAPVTVYLITMDLRETDPRFLPLTERHREIVQYALNLRNPESRAVLKDATEEYCKTLKGGKNDRGFYTPYAQARLLVSELGLPDKLLYLDADTMLCKDIRELWNTDVEGYELAAVKDVEGHIFIKPSYFNSGVLLMNMKVIRETGLFERVRKRIRTRRMIMPDQSALNSLAKKKLYLPYKFNEQRAVKDDTVVKHFCRGFKWYGPFFKIYNYKQTDRERVHNLLKTNVFDAVYEKYDMLAERFGTEME